MAQPILPPEGRAGFLEDHPFDLVRTPLSDSVLVEQVAIPMSDEQWDEFRDAPVGSVPGGGFYLGHVEVSDHTAFEAPDPQFWVDNGYGVLLIDLPGMGRSTSVAQDPPPHGARWAEVMQWLEEQPWCTGDVAMSGVSALCATQWMAAMDPAPPQLKAIIPWEGFNETGPGGGYGGIPETAFPAWLGQVWIGPNVNPAGQGPEPMLFDWPYDTSRISVPALVSASFSDQELHTWDTFDAFTRMQSEHRWLFNHRRQKWGAFYGPDELALQLRFLDRFCKGVADPMDDVPRIRLEINEDRTTYKVVTAEEWPVPGTRYESLHLDASTASLTLEPVAQRATVEFAPAPVDSIDNRAIFDYTFTEDTDLVGHMALTLSVEGVETDDVDLFVGVEKLDTDGNEVYFFSASGGNANGPVTRGWLRASKRTLKAARSTDYRPVPDLTSHVPLPHGEPATVTIPLMPSGTTFRAGEALRLVVQSWSTPGQWEGGMPSQQRLLEVFVELADTLIDEFDVMDFMHTLTETSVEMAGADAAGLMLADQRGNLQVVTATTGATRDLELFELEHGEGPCIDCFTSGEQVTNVDVDEAQRRWPRFTVEARKAGFDSVQSLPLRLRDQVIGAMNLYMTGPGQLSATDVSVCQALADMATIGLLQERAIREQSLVVEQLQGALNSRVVIEQAKGALVERLDVPPDGAFFLMRRYARNTGRPLLTIASQVLDGTLILSTEPSA